MTVRWSPEAAADFAAIVTHIQTHNSRAAERIARVIDDSIVSLEFFPHRGRAGRMESTREPILSPLPFLAVYRVTSEVVEIIRILHGSQRWP